MILLLCREIYIGSFYQHAPPLISSTERQQQLIKIHDLIDSFLAENIPAVVCSSLRKPMKFPM